MSRWGLIADVHLGNHRILAGPTEAGVNLRCRLIGQALERALRAAREAGCQRVAILGDLFDCAKPSPEVVGVAARAIAAQDLEVFVLPGNHDCSSDEPGNHALAALCRTQNCRVVDEPTYLEDGVILAPFSPRPPVEYFRGVLAGYRDIPREPAYLLGHVGIVGVNTPSFIKDGRNTITVEEVFELGLQAPNDTILRGFYSGDFHRHEIHEGVCGAVNIVQVGALCQADFGDPSEVGKLGILDTDKGGIVEIIDIPGPRLVSLLVAQLHLKPAHWGDGLYKNLDQCDVFLRVVCFSDEEQREAEAILASPPPFVRGWQIQSQPTAAQQSEVVEAVRGAVQVGEALREWAAAQPEPEAVRERAVQIAEECLR